MNLRPRIYLDHAATSWPKSEAVIDAMNRYVQSCGAAAGRGAYHAAAEADLIIKREIASYRFRHESRETDETLVRFREHHEAIKTDELAKALIRLKKGGSADDVLAQFANQLTNKLLHRPTQQLKAGNNDIIKVISDLYQLDKRSE